MGALGLAIAAVATIPAAQPVTDPLVQWRPMIADASQRFAIPADWIERVIRAESAGRTILNGHPIRSRVGAIGLMQLMPATWIEMRQTYRLGADPDDPHDNIIAGTAYLRQMYDRFGYPGLFAGYNAGPARYSVSLATGQRLPAETIAYLATVTRMASGLTASRRVAAVQSLFVVRHDGLPGSLDGTQPPSQADMGRSLFAVRSVTP